ncbi:hypothetical protein [Aeoliella sp.]|uniref:hypothetical protein n=1 Tax=Aeoliella sp. TaxID=2795800 RepID=UPI003CCB809D
MRNVLACAIVVALVLVTGCGEGQKVSGTVTVDGSPLPKGHIGFAPAAGSGERFGAEVLDGHYSISGMTPGKKRVTVTSMSEKAPMSREEAMANRGNNQKELIPADHPKNGQVVDVTEKTSTLDFEY